MDLLIVILLCDIQFCQVQPVAFETLLKTVNGTSYMAYKIVAKPSYTPGTIANSFSIFNGAPSAAWQA